MNAETIKATLPRDLMASVVVFLVALPLCMGIAIASGLPPAKGVITGIVGGLVVGWLAGAPLQVSGPAAGLTVLVFELVQQYGAAMLGPILLLAGALQLLAGRLKLGCWFRVTAPAVVYGMLAGIGILIVLSQLHVMMDAQPEASGLDNLGAFPAALWAALPFSGGNGMAAASLGLLTIACMWTWDRLRPQRLRLLPGALLGVAAATLVGLWLGLDVRRVEVPDNLADAISWLQPADLLAFADPGLLVAALAVAFIASAETLLSAAAVDRMHQGPRADFDRELTAQGVGNMLCGVLGALPMTGVIVRSSANVQAGARTRLSAMLHALWLLAAVVLLAALLEQIPVASLAGVLVYTGLKLIDLDALRQLGRYGRMAMLIHVATALTIVATDLLTGVLLGFALTLAQLAWQASRLKIGVVRDGRRVELRMQGAATFLRVPQLARALQGVPQDAWLHVPMAHLRYIDHACMELLEEWQRSNQASGARLIIEARALTRRVEGRRRQAAHLAAAAAGN
ncbi:SulP family inorganic anion transporter [Pseudomonas stutzeri]|jgi:MFS superfamily sulfate permease-like transporter|uniref:SulP family inorganic anion transporter n=1 Tax=Stutzerimonas stutzeri TaxID=316 RepID=UPI001EE9F757|nr:SulP family inorganic anion transporter [Stutzerimonas stutzeri]MCF0017004.1 SulP family inorganic anion transporter [Stutzerimonas stutzeri]MCF0020759.1 SulP family inorganic anion transporter [Stutzerimonas stutzeri]MDH0103046.1 SulP family inorganic anion transporter [Stutzerimonas stutzeri]MDH0184880.1 SulP family inorganic anion transporter [Stutzerimonas stutzeri]MDH0214135.1 SulP family inorganic anion transporter [Stutzerimonas stutzeri]